MLRLLLSLFIIFAFIAESVYAFETPVVIESVRVGIESHYKNGLWTPITVGWLDTRPGESRTLKIKSSDSDCTPITYHYEVSGERAVVLAKLGRRDEPIQVYFEEMQSPLEIEFAPKSYPVPPPVNAERPIYLIIGNEDIGLQGAVAELMLREDRRPLLVKVKSLADLPDKWFGYESIEMVVLTTTEPQLFDGLTAESPQIKALDDWLKLGGKMLLCAGKDAASFLGSKAEGGEDGFLRLFLPGQFDGMTELRSGTPLERLVNSQRQIFMNGTDEAPFMKVPRITEPRGIVFVKDGDVPLVLRAAHGLGTIIYFGGDLSERPLNNWRDRVALVRNIMQWNTERRGAVDPRSGAMLQLGYNDIAGQIRSALDQFEGVRIVPFSVILVILTAYWLIIGLFDWFLVHKVLKRPMLTWVTFPLWIVLFSVLTYVLATPGRPGNTLENNLTLFDVDSETGVTRISSWWNLYSPIGDQYGTNYDDIHNYNDIQDYYGYNGYISWNGLPGSGLGGMAPKTVSPPVWQIGSEQDKYMNITNVPIQVRSTKSFLRRHYVRCSDEPMMTAQLSDVEGIPIGTIEIPDNFRYLLKNCILVYGRWALELGEIQSGQTINLTRTSPRRDLRDLLIPPKTLENEHLRGMATYNPQSTDLEYIIRVMSLHRALGGYESTGLHHAYQPSLDMSNLLTTDRALLLGVEVSNDLIFNDVREEGVYTTTFFRQSFPITLTPSSPRWQGERTDTGSGGAFDEKIRTDFIDQKRDDYGAPRQ